MYKNLLRITDGLNINLRELTNLTKTNLSKITKINIDWKAKFIKELLLCREGSLYCSLSSLEINSLIDYFCLK